MDLAANILREFPPDIPLLTDADYDKLAKAHVKRVQVLKVDDLAQLLKLLDPATHTISCAILLANKAAQKALGEKLLDHLVTFLLKFDSRQIRYVGNAFSDLIDLAASSKCLPNDSAVHAISKALMKLDPAGHTMTSHHLSLVKLAYQTNAADPVLPVMEKPILFFPSAPNPLDKQHPLCSLSTPPPSYITKETGLTRAIRTEDVLEYELVCGLIYCSKEMWENALAAFERVAAHPSRNGGVSKIMVDGYCKHLLVSLLLRGQATPLPEAASQDARKTLEILAQPYLALASYFARRDDPREAVRGLKQEAEAQAQRWAADNNVGLVRAVVAAHQKWQIIRLREVYATRRIADVRLDTCSAETGGPLPTDGAVEELVAGMIASGMLPRASIERPVAGVGGDGASAAAYVRFLPAEEELSEEAYAGRLGEVAGIIRELEPVLRVSNERLSANRDYLKFLAKEQAARQGGRRDKDGPAGSALSFVSQVEEEDLMT